MADMGALKAEEQDLTAKLAQARAAVKDGDLKSSASAQSLKEIKLRQRRKLSGHLGKVYKVDWGLNSRALVSASQDGKLIIWDTHTGGMRGRIKLKSSWVMTCAFSPGLQEDMPVLVASGGLDNICTIHSVGAAVDYQATGSEAPVQELEGHTGYLSCCRFLDERNIVTASGDLTCGLWDVEAGRRVSVFSGHMGDVMSLALDPSKRTFISGGCDAKAKLWDIRSGKCVQTFAGHDSDINAVTFFPGGSCFATGADDSSSSTCRLFDIRADQEINSFSVPGAQPGHYSGLSSVAFSHSGRLLFAASQTDYNVHVFDTVRAEPLGRLAAHEGRVSCVTVSPDGKGVATASWDYSVRLWN